MPQRRSNRKIKIHIIAPYQQEEYCAGRRCGGGAGVRAAGCLFGYPAVKASKQVKNNRNNEGIEKNS